eukprot:TRINITY_DN7629_c0_g1_i1.p1 TRINITY_DN7629_c0_g1~~TRINITY_DN7629_c0_g1_i1.p1  ORF type:complete len:337 (+),score=55.80 TRINITY_DN7629_c0_g1_i1:67-1077(+)
MMFNKDSSLKVDKPSVLKVDLDGDIRRTRDWPNENDALAAGTNVVFVKRVVRRLFGLCEDESLQLKYRDDEGNLCTLVDETLSDALVLASCRGGVLRLLASRTVDDRNTGVQSPNVRDTVSSGDGDSFPIVAESLPESPSAHGFMSHALNLDFAGAAAHVAVVGDAVGRHIADLRERRPISTFVGARFPQFACTDRGGAVPESRHRFDAPAACTSEAVGQEQQQHQQHHQQRQHDLEEQSQHQQQSNSQVQAGDEQAHRQQPHGHDSHPPTACTDARGVQNATQASASVVGVVPAMLCTLAAFGVAALGVAVVATASRRSRRRGGWRRTSLSITRS